LLFDDKANFDDYLKSGVVKSYGLEDCPDRKVSELSSGLKNGQQLFWDLFLSRI
jgi:hypothetical protein